MPIYEYQCNACGHQLEAFQKMSEDALTECPLCHKSTLQKLVSAAGFQLKGTGWYATDFKNKGKTEANQTKSSSSSSSEVKTTETKTTETKTSSGDSTKTGSTDS